MYECLYFSKYTCQANLSRFPQNKRHWSYSLVRIQIIEIMDQVPFNMVKHHDSYNICQKLHVYNAMLNHPKQEVRLLLLPSQYANHG